jgi:hypothetical protein
MGFIPSKKEVLAAMSLALISQFCFDNVFFFAAEALSILLLPLPYGISRWGDWPAG